MRLTVVVCAHALDRVEQTRRALRSALEGDRPPDELLLVLDGGDELEHALGERLPAGVTMLPNAGSGASDARTTALKVATGDVTVFLDDDAYAEPGWLGAFEDAFANPRVLGAGGLVMPEWEDAGLAWPDELLWIVGSTYAGHRSDAGPISRPIGASMAGRTAALLQIGGFSSAFGPRGGVKSSSNEELATFAELTRRFGPERIWYVPTAVVHHFAPATRCSFGYLWRRSLVEGRSKADVRAEFGNASMGHDRSYARRVLAPAVIAHLVRAARRRSLIELRAAAAIVASAVAAAIGYLKRRAEHRLAPPAPGAAVDNRPIAF